MKLLRIDASSRIEHSESRKIADQFQQQWQKSNPDGSVIIRDIIKQPIPHIQQKTIEGFYTPSENFTPELQDATKLSDQLIAELTGCDIVLISTPMYNFGVPSALKAWVDHIVRINKTFGVSKEGAFYGMVKNVNAYIITAAGAVYASEEMKALNFLQPYLQTVLGLIGITDVTFISLEGTTMDAATFDEMKADALEKIIKI
ncbi:FMN-dependent NADH-azoreductase [Aquimarina celericrescens]|uniref:FMN dependent NADH:quinone oxidoreductase n=1 Tax=Aquimarina celericrescens TaxID=1964542 RepID=A0ABW5AWA7_9FLAO|nr:NAD(P)H-dependent oxidoreductase [Aquimarina celericrescens]